MTVKARLIGSVLLITAPLASPVMAKQSGPTMVQVHCHNQMPDFQNPWQVKGVATKHQIGFYIAKNRILTVLSGCEYAAAIQVSLLGQPKRFAASEVNASGAYDLLELSVGDELAKALPTPPRIYGLSAGFKGTAQPLTCHYRLKRYDTKAVRCAVRDVAISPRAFIKEPIVLGKAYSEGMVPIAIGSPVTAGDQLAGLVYRVGPGPAQFDLIPSDAIRRFRTRKALWGLSTGMVYRIDLAKEDQSYYGLPRHDGVLVTEVTKGGLFDGVLRPGDQLLKVAGHSVDTAGYIYDRRLGRVPYDHLSLTLADRDQITITYRRGKKVSTVTLKGKKGGAEVVRGERPRYGILAGLVVQEMSMSLLRSVWGNSFEQKAPEYLVTPFADTLWGAGGKLEGQLVISSVLPDPSNIGYRTLKWQPLVKAQGVAVKSLAQLHEQVQGAIKKGAPLVLTLGQPERKLVLDTAEWQAMRERVKRHNRLPSHAVLF